MKRKIWKTCKICGETFSSSIRRHYASRHSDLSKYEFMCGYKGVTTPPKCMCGKPLDIHFDHAGGFRSSCGSKECLLKIRGCFESDNEAQRKAKQCQKEKQTGFCYDKKKQQKGRDTQKRNKQCLWDPNFRQYQIDNKLGPFGLSKDKQIERLDKSHKTFYKNHGYNWGDPKGRIAKAYIAKVLDTNTNSIICKIGIGSVFRRWACILSLCKSFEIIELKESNVSSKRIESIENHIHDEFKSSKYFEVENKTGVFSEDNRKPFKQSTGYTEWFSGEIYEDAVKRFNEFTTMNDVTESFRKWLSENHVRRLDG